MRQKLNAIFLLAGTAIGSGMLSLPIILSKIDTIPMVILMLIFTALTYFSAIVRAELNFQSSASNSLEGISLLFSGPKVAWISKVSIRLLFFALLSAYIYGLSDILSVQLKVSPRLMMCCIACAVFALLAYSEKLLLLLNRWLFAALLVVVLVIMLIMAAHVDRSILLVPTRRSVHLGDLTIIAPILFTSFGFHGTIPSVTKLCRNDVRIVKLACLWGSVIPACVYTIWTASSLCLLKSRVPEQFQNLASGSVNLGEFIATLSNITNLPIIGTIIWVIATLAIVTSIFGVGLSLVDDLQAQRSQNHHARILICGITIIPPLLIAIIVPNAFIQVLAFAGLLLVVIAFLVPTFLFFKAKIFQRAFIKCLRYKSTGIILMLSGIAIATLECINLLRHWFS
ncbi:MAG: hypothetical protein LBF94_01085 [Puniceicoccales bacterium]|jgi:tyrosine-specific transport protein|nr:hypothetical protein [Puniceicoccales bacterium]